MEAHPEGQKSLALYGFFRRPRTEEDGPLLSVKQIRFTPEVQAGMQQQEMELRAEAARANAPAVRPVGRPHMDPAMRPAPAPKRPVGRPCASTHVQAPPAEPERLLVLFQLSAHTDSVTLQLLTNILAINAAVQAREAAAKAAEQQVWVRMEVLRNHRVEERVKLLLRQRPFAAKNKTWSP
eukprot:854574-Pelagomonas_calceolata.AAC.1